MTENPQTPRRRFRWHRLALAVSLAINLLIVGLVIGTLWSFGRGSDRWHHSHGSDRVSAAPYTRALAPDDRKALRRALGAELRKSGAATRTARRAGYAEALELLRRPDFDANAFGAVMQRQFSGVVAARNSSRRLLAERLAAMSEAERQAYAARLEEVLTRGRAPRGKRPDVTRSKE